MLSQLSLITELYNTLLHHADTMVDRYMLFD